MLDFFYWESTYAMKINNTANFINPLSPQKYDACIRWYRQSCAFLVVTSCILLGISAYHYWHLHTLQQASYLPLECMPTTTEPAMQTLQKELHLLENRQEEFTSLMKKKSELLAQLNTLITLMPPTICLTTCNFEQGIFTELSGQACALKMVTEFLQIVRTMPHLHAMHLTKVQPMVTGDKKESIQFTLQCIATI